jgi:hypothetical protein
VRVSAAKAFASYPLLERCVVDELGSVAPSAFDNGDGGGGGGGGGVAACREVPSAFKTLLARGCDGGMETGVFLPFLHHAAQNKLLDMLDALDTSTCHHPMWRSFEALYTRVLSGSGIHSVKKSGGAEAVVSDMLEVRSATLQRYVTPYRVALERVHEPYFKSLCNVTPQLPALAARAQTEGDNAVRAYERESTRALTMSEKAKICKHFARVQTMGYIVRQTLLATVVPIVLRDVRDGLFRGVRFGAVSWTHSVVGSECSCDVLLCSSFVLVLRAQHKTHNQYSISTGDAAAHKTRV